jgi:peroxiredoxin
MSQIQSHCLLLLLAATSLVLHSPTRSLAQKEKSLADRVAAIKQEHVELEKWFHDTLVANRKDQKKVQDANDEYFKKMRSQAAALQSLIKEHPADDAAFEGVLVLVGELSYFLDDEITKIVLDHHLEKPEVGQLCFDARQRGGEDWVRRILKAAAEKHPQNAVRGVATFSLGDYYRGAARPFGTPPPKEQSERLLKKATDYYQQTIKTFADVTTPDGKWNLGERAKHELARLKNLENLQVGRPAPPIDGTDLEGKPLKLEDYRGKVVVVVFWGSWCGPCMAQVPHERELHARLAGKPFALLGVSCGDPLDLAKETAKKHRMEWPCWWDGDETRSGPIQTDYDTQHWPSVYVIDAEGIIRAIDAHGAELDKAVDEALEKLRPEGKKPRP